MPVAFRDGTPNPAPRGQFVNLPAVCATCSTIFPSGLTVAAGGPAIFLDNLAGPCPGCGGMGRVPDGVIDLSRPDVVAALQAIVALGSIDNLRLMVGLVSAASKEELLAVAGALSAGPPDRSEDQVVQAVQQAAPRLHDLAGLIRNRDSRMELATWLTLLATIISIVIAVKTISHDEITPPRQDQIIRVVTQAPTATTAPAQGEGRRTGRNEPCPCGSGMKFKRCHGSPTARP
jgi:SEC-C motif